MVAALLSDTPAAPGSRRISTRWRGKPVVVTDASACDYIEDGRTGLIVDNEPEALAGAVNTLLEDPDLATELTRHGRASGAYDRRVRVRPARSRRPSADLRPTVSAAAVHTVKDRQVGPPSLPLDGLEAVERRLALLPCGTQRRRRHAEEGGRALRRADARRPGTFSQRLRPRRWRARRRSSMWRWTIGCGSSPRPRHGGGSGAWRTSCHPVDPATLEQAGIRAPALKGSVLARQLCGDVACAAPGTSTSSSRRRRPSARRRGDGTAGLAATAPASRSGALPLLHETLTHPTMPRVGFTGGCTGTRTEVLTRRAHPRRTLGPPAAGHATPRRFRAHVVRPRRVRRPADAGGRRVMVGGEMRRRRHRGHHRGPDRALSGAGRALRVGAHLLGPLTGVPARPRHAVVVERRAAGDALSSDRGQVRGQRQPRGCAAGSARRRRRRRASRGAQVPSVTDGASRHDPALVHVAGGEHLLRMARLWVLGLGAAALRAWKRRPLPTFGETLA